MGGSDSKLWEQRVANAEQSLGRAEKALWQKIEPVLIDALDEIKANGKLETIYVRTEMDKLSGTLKTFEETSIAHNVLGHLFDRTREEWVRFLRITEQFGFTQTNVARIYLTLEVAIALLSTELFKLVLLFHMKDVSYDVSKFPSTMRDCAPKTWHRLKPFVDNDFRNALAHGTYTIVSKGVVLYKDAKLSPFDKMKLHEFMMRTKEQNVLFMCLFNVLAAKKKSGFFT